MFRERRKGMDKTILDVIHRRSCFIRDTAYIIAGAGRGTQKQVVKCKVVGYRNLGQGGEIKLYASVNEGACNIMVKNWFFIKDEGSTWYADEEEAEKKKRKFERTRRK